MNIMVRLIKNDLVLLTFIIILWLGISRTYEDWSAVFFILWGVHLILSILLGKWSVS